MNRPQHPSQPPIARARRPHAGPGPNTETNAEINAGADAGTDATSDAGTDAGTTPESTAGTTAGTTPGADAGAAAAGPLARGLEVIRAALKTLPGRPGVYRMLDRQGAALYVGKAKNLRRRVVNYTHIAQLPNRLRRMVALTQRLEVVTTHTETEALLLESNLIKRLRPRFNVLLRDDKSFPSILITGDHPWPQLAKHRGAHRRKGDYFGPFASAGAVNETLAAMERAFLLRSCSDAVFASRTRPCLLHQIKRCAAPCVGRIGRHDYERLVSQARAFLSGQSGEVQQELAQRMQAASDALEFERAAVYRDRIRAMTQVQAHQDINLPRLGDVDVIAAHNAAGRTCIQVFFFRGGRNYGNRAYFPRHEPEVAVDEVLAAFIGQFYDNKTAPRRVLLSHPIADQALLCEALGARAGRRVELVVPQRGAKRKLMAHALTNAREALGRHLSESASQRRLLEGVAEIFGLDGLPARVEVYDNSHISGTNAVGAMIVAGPEGLIKSAYRTFTIRTVGMPVGGAVGGAVEGSAAERGAAAGGTPGHDNAPENTTGSGNGNHDAGPRPAPGDDYAMIREVLTRRFARALREDPERGSDSWPDLLLIDGGAGHLSSACGVLADLGLTDIPVAAISKGRDRNAGRERFHLPGRPAFSLDPQDPVLYFLQRLRDEAHRFAIGTHRARRAKGVGGSVLDEIPGIGPRRKRALLHHFGSARAISRAGLADLERVDGISSTVAGKIYEYFHETV